MSTKTIALENTVYEKLARRKRDGESFTKTIDRLVEEQQGSGTCADAVREAAALWGGKPTKAEAEALENVVRSNRKQTDWSVETIP